MHDTSHQPLVVAFSKIVLNKGEDTVSCLGGAIGLGLKGLFKTVVLYYDLLTEMQRVEMDLLLILVCLGSDIL